MRSFPIFFLLLSLAFDVEAGRWFGSSSQTSTPSVRDYAEAKVAEAKMLAKIQDDLEEQSYEAIRKAKKAAKKARIDAERTMKVTAIDAKTSAKKLQAETEERAAKLHHQSKKALLEADRLLQRQAGSRNLMAGWPRLQRQAGSRDLMADLSGAAQQSKKTAKKALAEVEREFQVKSADAKASAKRLRADAEEQAAKAKQRSQKTIRNARDDSMSYLERKTREIKGIFRRD